MRYDRWLAGLTPEARSRIKAYHPCSTGLHLCGVNDDGADSYPITLGNFRARDAASARAMWERAKAEFADPEGEVLVDLMVGDCTHEDDFNMHRQMIPRLKAFLASIQGSQP